MFVRIDNAPRPYAWGSTSAISMLLGSTPSGGPEAELWLGAHPGSSAVLTEPSAFSGARTLAEWIAAAPSDALGGHPRLPFLLKILAAASPLSLQAHPSAEQARDGYQRENALGIPLDAATRNYKDPYPKPELIYALSERFDALCGFRPVAETRAMLAELGLDDLAARLESLPATVEWLVTRGEGVDALVAQVVALAVGVAPLAAGVAPLTGGAVSKTKEIGGETARSDAETAKTGQNSLVFDEPLDTVRMLAAEYPDDPGIVISLLLNRVTLKRGEALYLPAGNIHAYLGGLGVELMTSSDNVLRGGLTPKHIDAAELLRVLDFTPTAVPYLVPEAGEGAASIFRPDGPGFALVHIEGAAEYELTGPAIAICTAGEFMIAGGAASVVLGRGESVYITPDERALVFTGDGELFLATTA